MKEIQADDRDWIYDLETYPNIFTFGILKADGNKGVIYEISDRKNQIQEILKCLRYLRDNKCRMVGFNNLGFDYPVLHEILQQAMWFKKKGVEFTITAEAIYEIAQKQIDSNKDNKFPNTIKQSDEIVTQIDLYKIHHFDNRARATSLKMLEFNMCLDNIEDLPFPVGTYLDHNEMDTLVNYNKDDLWATLSFYLETLKAIKFREELSKKYGKNFINANDTKIGKDYFIMQLEKNNPGTCYTPSGKRRQTKRKIIKLKDCLFDYYDFKRPEFIAVKKWLEQQKITETKGVFSEIEEHLLGDVTQYAVMRTKKKKFPGIPTDEELEEFYTEHPKGWIEERELKSGKKSFWKHWRVTGKPKGDTSKEGTLNVVVDGFRFDFGTGGIHGSVENKVVRSDDNYKIIDADVTSMYPSLAIANRVFPKHLGVKFCDIYKEIFEERKKYKKGTLENALFKLALNGVYGDSNNKYSPLYDPQYTMAVTINGQLSLCLLAERLMMIKNLTLIQVNTDGITVKCPIDKEQEYYRICNQWEKDTKLPLEYVEYKSMFLRDVNNYLALTVEDKIKRKGTYEYEGLDWNKNHSSKVIAKAAEAVMVHGEDLEEFIHNHKNKWDFMLRAKVPRNSRLVLIKGDEEIPLQNICRYYPKKDGGKLIKIMPPLPGKEEKGERRLSIDAEWNVQPCNDISEFNWDIDYDYYIENTKKLIIKD